jgi:hypothetical protein
MDSASDFGSGGWGFESPQGLFFLLSLFGRTLVPGTLGCDNMAEWLRRQPAKLMGFARVGSNPTVVVLFFLPPTGSNQKKKGGDARIELATSCTLSKNHTTRPITQCAEGPS